MKVKKLNEISKNFEDDYSFKSKINNGYINNESISDIDNLDWIDISECTIYWDYELNVASWGIDYILVKINKILLDVIVYTDDDQEIPRTFEYNILNSDIDTRSEDNKQVLPFTPQEIEITHLETSDDNKTKIEVIF